MVEMKQLRFVSQREKIIFPIAVTIIVILLVINDIANRMNSELKNENPLFISILNGSFMFAADLMKRITFPCEISFVKIASYHGTTSSDEMLELIGLKENLKGRTVVIIEDIVDSGKTMSKVLEMLQH